MSPAPNRLQQALSGIDAANAEDPNRELDGGVERPKELLYAERMSAWLERLEPGASEALRLAIRAQHLRRWAIPRADYPMDRAGYRRWRTDLAKYHARLAGEIIEGAGYDAAAVRRVQDLLQKKRLKTDPEAQLLEDVACLVFLEHYFADFAARHPEDKVIAILQKTWNKMSPRGHEAALALALPAPARRLVERALG